MEPTNTIGYRGKKYPVFSLDIIVEGKKENVNISVESLQSELLPDWDWRDTEAEHIDESIFFYIPDDVAEKPEAEIIKFVEDNI